MVVGDFSTRKVSQGRRAQPNNIPGWKLPGGGVKGEKNSMGQQQIRQTSASKHSTSCGKSGSPRMPLLENLPGSLVLANLSGWEVDRVPGTGWPVKEEFPGGGGVCVLVWWR